MDERDKSLAEEQAKETAAAAEISAAETEGSEDEIVLPPKRGETVRKLGHETPCAQPIG